MSETGTICKHYKNCRYYQVSALKNLEKTSFALPLIVSQGNFSADRAKCGIKQKAENHDLKKLNKLPLVDASCINIPHFVRPARSYASLTAGLVCLHLSADADVRIIKNGIQKVYLSRLSLRNIKQQTSFFLVVSFSGIRFPYRAENVWKYGWQSGKQNKFNFALRNNFVLVLNAVFGACFNIFLLFINPLSIKQ